MNFKLNYAQSSKNYLRARAGTAHLEEKQNEINKIENYKYIIDIFIITNWVVIWQKDKMNQKSHQTSYPTYMICHGKIHTYPFFMFVKRFA